MQPIAFYSIKYTLSRGYSKRLFGIWWGMPQSAQSSLSFLDFFLKISAVSVAENAFHPT